MLDVKKLYMPCVLFLLDETEAVLLVDVKNAFNSLNHATSLFNIQVVWPSIAPVLVNIY